MCHDAPVADEELEQRRAELDEQVERFLPAGPARPNSGGHRVSARSLFSQSPFFALHGVTPSVAFLTNGRRSRFRSGSHLFACQVQLDGGPWQTVDGFGRKRRIALLPESGDFAVRVIHHVYTGTTDWRQPPELAIAYELPRRPIRADDALLVRAGYLEHIWKQGWKHTWLSGVIGAGPIRRRIAVRGEPEPHPRYVDLRTGRA